MAATKLDPNFIPLFAREYWRRKPGVFRNVLPDLMSDEDILGSIRKAARMVTDPRNSAKKVSFYPFAGGREVRGLEALKFIPSEHSVEAYCANLSARLGGDSFGLVVNGFDEVCPEVWEPLKDVVDDLATRVGVPPNQVDCFLMAGNYRSTTFGIHLDSSIGVMSLALRGQKRMLAWPRHYFEEREVRKSRMSAVATATVLVLEDIEQFVADADDLEYGPGDLAYWPESYWHVGHQRQEQQLWITLSLGFRLATSLADDLAKLVESTLRQRLGDRDILIPRAKLDPVALPAEFAEAFAALDDIVGAGEIQRGVDAAWARHCAYITRPAVHRQDELGTRVQPHEVAL